MKIVHAFVTVSALLAGAAALKCYKCSLQDSDANCNSRGPTQCDSAAADTCMTLSAKSDGMETITKLCGLRQNCRRRSLATLVTTCKPGSESVSGCVQCCQGDACNAVTSFQSEATMTKVSVMALVAMATLACIFQTV